MIITRLNFLFIFNTLNLLKGIKIVKYFTFVFNDFVVIQIHFNFK